MTDSGLLLRTIAAIVAIAFGINSGFAQGKAQTLEIEQPENSLRLPENTDALKCLRILDATAVSEEMSNHKKAPVRTAPMSPDYAKPRILGSIIASLSGLPEGLYRVPTAATDDFTAVFEGPYANGGGVLVGSTYYATYTFTLWNYYVYVVVEAWDIDTGQLLSSRYASSYTILATDAALDPVTNQIYGCYYNPYGSGFCLAVADYDNMVSEAVCDLSDAWNACAIDSKGQLFAIDYNSRLLKVDKTNGDCSAVGTLPIAPGYLSSAAFDLSDDSLYWTVVLEDGTSGLYRIDTNTADAELVKSFDITQQVCGLVVPPAAAADLAPAAVSDLAFDFERDNLTGTVAFTAPSKTYNGFALSGELSYSVSADGEVLSTGKTTAGAPTAVDVTFPSAGTYKISVNAANAEGEGVKTYLNKFIGNDTPLPPTVTLEYYDETFRVSWTEVTGSVNGGYVDPEQITYSVVRFPDNVTVAQGIKTTSYSDRVGTPESLISYYYEVCATYRDKTSSPGCSNELTIGVISPPYTETFDTQAAFNTYSTIDENNDGQTWYWWQTRKRAHVLYNSRIGINDWLVTPPLKLKGGMSYPVDFVTYSSGDYVEKFEVMLGTAPDVGSMTAALLPATEVTQAEAVQYSFYITPEVDGLYYVGFHCISDPDTDYLDVDDIHIGEGVPLLAPDAVTGLSVNPDSNGEKKAAISFTTPLTDGSGADLSFLQSAVVYRDSQLVHTFRFPQPGESLSWTDEPETPGYYTYYVYAVNGEGQGKPASEKVFVGVNRTEAPGNVSIKENGNSGNVTIQWEEPAYDVDGNPARTKYVTYSITSGDAKIAEGITATEYSFDAYDGEGQAYVQFGVTADTESGSSETSLTEMTPIGKPYQAPFNESFANGSASSILAFESIVGLNPTYWELRTDNDIPNLTAQDGDNGYLAFTTDQSGCQASVTTGKIDLAGIANPGVSFYSNPLTNGSLNTNDIVVFVNDGSGYVQLRNVVMSELLNDGWNKITVPLTDYSGKTIRLRFLGVNTFNIYTVLDNIVVGEIPAVNLTAYHIEAPVSVAPDQLFSVSTTIQNTGSSSSGTYAVWLLSDGERVESRACASLAAEKSATVTFNRTLSVLSPESVDYQVEIVSDDDSDGSDNLSDIVTVGLALPEYPAVNDLMGAEDNGNVVLSWSEPDMSYELPEASTDDFESYTSWSTSNVGDWTFVDGDMALIGGLQNITLPGITGRQSFFVMDNTLPAITGNDSFEASSGNKYLANMYTGGVVDDWAITPRLSGEAQTVTFMARSYHEDYPETFQVLYSTTDTQTTSFTLMATYSNLPDEWQKFEIALPDGARYMAIRCVSDDAFMLFIDDVTFVRASASEGLQLMAYNVYDGGTRLQRTQESSYTHTEAAVGGHEYVVTVVYDKGESRPSNVVTLSMSAADAVEADIVTINSVGLDIVIAEAEGYAAEIFSPAGLNIWATDAMTSGTIKIRVPAPGVYLVRVGEKQAKLLVKP